MSATADINIYRESQAAAGLLRELQAQAGETEDLSDDDAELVIASECNLKEAIQAAIIANMDDEAHCGAIKSVLSTLAARLARKTARVERRRGAIMAAMELVGLQRLELPTATLSVGKGVCKVIVTDEAMLPRVYMRSPPARPDLKEIGSALKEGKDVPGAVLSNSAPTLTIRTR